MGLIITNARKFYSYYIKKNRINKRKQKKFKKFGKGSEMFRPCKLDKYIKNISIGNNTIILHGSRIQLFCQNKKCDFNITIGDNCYIGYNLSILAGADITIGNRVLIASNVIISSENHGMDPESKICYMDQPLICKPVSIGDGCWIGEKVCILAGISIGEKCIVGASSVVTKNIPDFCIVAGNPAKIIKKYDFEMHQWVKV